jgi:hypothetical protein
VQLRDLYSWPDIIPVIKSRRMRWVGHVERMGKGELRIEFWWKNLYGRDYLEDLDVDETVILKYI